MGYTDTPPPHVPTWAVPASTGTLGVGFVLWSLTYILMTRRALATRSSGMPLLALATNVSWEVVYLFYVVESLPEMIGFAFWLLLDVGLVYSALKFGHIEFERAGAPWIGRHIAPLLAIMTAIGLWGNFAFVFWWLEEPGRGFGGRDGKRGKWWRGQDGYDTTEMAYWSAAVAQLIASSTCLAMLLERQHSRGTSYLIWACRFLGSIMGLPVTGLLLWWCWPEAHGYIWNPFSIFLVGAATSCDILYPFVLFRIRQLEGDSHGGRSEYEAHKKRT